MRLLSVSCSLHSRSHLLGPSLGDGPKWSLCSGVQRSMEDEEGKVKSDVAILRMRGLTLLQEALSRGKHADVAFELDDGTRPVGGHRSVLCNASDEFNCMFNVGMQEEKTGVVRMRGVCAASVKALLEWVYIGELAMINPQFMVFRCALMLAAVFV